MQIYFLKPIKITMFNGCFNEIFGMLTNASVQMQIITAEELTLPFFT